MADRAQIETLCREVTTLDTADIELLCRLADSLQLVADLNGCDLFIDCRTRNPDLAVVIAHAKPTDGTSLYDRNVEGEYAGRLNEPAVLRTLEIGAITNDMIAVTQEERSVRQRVVPIKNSSGEIIACLIQEKDISEDLQTERNLSLMAQTVSQLTDALVLVRNKDHGIPSYVNDGIVIFDHNGVVLYVNPVAQRIYRQLGFAGELEGLEFDSISLEDLDFEEIVARGQTLSNEVRFGNSIFNIRYVSMKGEANKNARVGMLITDETEARSREKELILRSVAIKEIHHRVKNNLQTIASLLRLQARRMDNESAKTAFSESISRVLSIAATHEILARNGVDDIELKVMLKKIVQSLDSDNQSEEKCIEVEITGDEIRHESEVATSIALIVNEILQNCYKHAFVGRSRGRITIEARRGRAFSSIKITDNGVGFTPQSVEERSSISLGTRIIEQLVKDRLGGTLEIKSSDRGTAVMFDFVTRESQQM